MLFQTDMVYELLRTATEYVTITVPFKVITHVYAIISICATFQISMEVVLILCISGCLQLFFLIFLLVDEHLNRNKIVINLLSC